MVFHTADVYDHILDNALGILVGTQVKFCAVPCLAQHVWNAVRIYGFVVVECVMVVVAVWVRCRKQRKHQKRIAHRWRHLQIVSSIVPAARNSVVHMACLVEPRLRIAAALHAEELEVRIAHHGIDLVAHDKGRRILLADFDAEARVRGERT